MSRDIIDIPIKPPSKIEKKSINDFEIDTSHYKVKGPKIIKTIDIDY